METNGHSVAYGNKCRLGAESIHVSRSITLIFHHNLDGLDYDYPAGEDQLLARIAGRAARSLRKVRLF